MNKCRKNNNRLKNLRIKIIKKKKEKKGKKKKKKEEERKKGEERENSTEPEKPNVEAEFYSKNKKDD